jgi:Family of unknown function (DUF6256)
MALLPAGLTVAGLTIGRAFQHVVAPTLFVFLLIVSMLVVVWFSWPWRTRSAARRTAFLPLVPLLRSLVVTAVAGYAVFLVIVAVFYVAIGGGRISVIGDAASGGAFLAFGVAVPLFLGLARLARRDGARPSPGPDRSRR